MVSVHTVRMMFVVIYCFGYLSGIAGISPMLIYSLIEQAFIIYFQMFWTIQKWRLMFSLQCLVKWSSWWDEVRMVKSNTVQKSIRSFQKTQETWSHCVCHLVVEDCTQTRLCRRLGVTKSGGLKIQHFICINQHMLFKMMTLGVPGWLSR